MTPETAVVVSVWMSVEVSALKLAEVSAPTCELVSVANCVVVSASAAVEVRPLTWVVENRAALSALSTVVVAVLT